MIELSRNLLARSLCRRHLWGTDCPDLEINRRVGREWPRWQREAAANIATARARATRAAMVAVPMGALLWVLW